MSVVTPVSVRTPSPVFESPCHSVRRPSSPFWTRPRARTVDPEREWPSGVHTGSRDLIPGPTDTESTYRECPPEFRCPFGHVRPSLSPPVSPVVYLLGRSGLTHDIVGSLRRDKGLRGPHWGPTPNLRALDRCPIGHVRLFLSPLTTPFFCPLRRS